MCMYLYKNTYIYIYINIYIYIYIYIYNIWYSEIMCATACQCEMCQLLAERLTYPSFQTTLSCTDETSKVETGLSAD